MGKSAQNVNMTIAIVGRPNVGKSTLFNVLSVKGGALVYATPGVTRDTRLDSALLGDFSFTLADTAGLEFNGEEMANNLNELTSAAIQQADILLFVVDGKTGITPEDEYLAQQLRASKRPVVLVVNKADVKESENTLYEAYKLGFGEGVCLSAEHRQGFDLLEDALVALVEKQRAAASQLAGAAEGEAEEQEPADEIDEEGLEPNPERFEKPEHMRLAIIGRPNAGKSTLVNTLCGSKRMLTGDLAGLTRESIATTWFYQGTKVELVDTPGVRKKARVETELEQMSVKTALRAIEQANTVLLLLDATTFNPNNPQAGPLERQDATLAAYAIEQGKPLVVGLNKWDKLKGKEACLEHVTWQLEQTLSQLKGVPVVHFSALKGGKGIARIMPTMQEAFERWQTTVATSALNRFLERIMEENPAPIRNGRRIKIKFMNQLSTCPPTFALWCNMPNDVPENYIRYLSNKMREAFNMHGVPMRMLTKSSSGGKNPYEYKRKKSNG